MRRILFALLLSLIAWPADAQQWDRVNGSMQVRSGPANPLVIIDQTNTSSNNKILSLRANGTEKCSVDVDGDLVCAGSFSFVNLTFTGQAIGPLDTDCSAPAYSGLGKLTTGVAVRTAPSVVTCVGGAAIDLTTATARTMQSSFTFATTNGTVTANRASLGTTAGAGLQNINTTAAAAGAQQISPYTLWRGNGWKTDATAASQTVDFLADVLPVQGSSAPTGSWRLGYSINGAATTNVLDVSASAVSMNLPIRPSTTGTRDVGADSLRWNDSYFSGNMYFGPAGAGTNGVISNAASGNGQLTFRNNALTAGIGLDFATDSVVTVNNRAQTGAAAIGQGPAASATSTYKLVKKVTGIADNTATDVLTVTIPNANHAATIKVTLLSSNGSTDAFESSRTAEGAVVVARTTGANAVAGAATLTLTQIATVAAGATHTLAYGVSAISGAVGATNTFTIQVTIDDSGNLGSNQVVVLAELINAESSGITIQ